MGAVFLSYLPRGPKLLKNAFPAISQLWPRLGSNRSMARCQGRPNAATTAHGEFEASCQPKINVGGCGWAPVVPRIGNINSIIGSGLGPTDFDGQLPVARLRAHAPEILRNERGNRFISNADHPKRGHLCWRLLNRCS